MNQRTNPRAATNAITPEHILARHTPAMQRIAARLRKLIHAAAPEVTEAAYPGWHAIGFRHPDCGYFCGVFPFDDHVKLIFEFGVLLEDPFGALEGEGKQVRHLTYRSARELQIAPLKFFLEQAVRLRVRKRKTGGRGG